MTFTARAPAPGTVVFRCIPEDEKITWHQNTDNSRRKRAGTLISSEGVFGNRRDNKSLPGSIIKIIWRSAVSYWIVFLFLKRSLAVAVFPWQIRLFHFLPPPPPTTNYQPTSAACRQPGLSRDNIIFRPDYPPLSLSLWRLQSGIFLFSGKYCSRAKLG